jgi:hypothetical protein
MFLNLVTQSLECLVLALFLQLEDNLALRLAVRLGEVCALGGAHSARYAAFHARMSHLLARRLV